MKRGVSILLACSVLLNVFLIIQRLRPVRAIASLNVATNIHFPDKVNASVRNIPKSPGFPAPSNPERIATRQFDWSAVESGDYKNYVENLRAIGCPPETIRDIVSQDLRKNYKRRAWEIVRKSTSTEYWSPAFVLGVRLEFKELTSLQELDRQYQWSHKELLGSAPDLDQDDPRDTIRKEVLARYGDLDWEKIEALTSIKNELHAELRQLPSSAHDGLVKSTEEKMARLLSEEEQRLHLLRSSALSKRIRESLRDHLPSEEEFRSVFFRLRDQMGSTDELNHVSPAMVRAAFGLQP